MNDPDGQEQRTEFYDEDFNELMDDADYLADAADTRNDWEDGE